MEKKIKVTIVVDHDMTRMGLSFALEKSGIIDVIGTSADGQEGVEQALELRPDLVVMDIGVPTIDGIEATRKIKNAVPEIKVLMNTSRDDDSDILDSFAAGADGYITKGATSEQTITAIISANQHLLTNQAEKSIIKKARIYTVLQKEKWRFLRFWLKV